MPKYLRRTLTWASLFTVFIGIVSVLAYALLPKPDIKHYTPYSNAFFDEKGVLLRLTLAEDQRYRLYQPLASIAPSVINATIEYEDQHFYSHSGVDVLALVRAAWSTYVIRKRRVGASTITMQLARLRWGISSNNLGGKIHQLYRAVQLSKHYSKDEILESYLNLAPYGRNIEGVAAASLIYFNKKPSQLSVPEALTLAVIPQNPNKRNPTKKSNLANLMSARQRLAERWLERYPNDGAIAHQLALPISARTPEQLPFIAPHFINYVNASRSKWSRGYVHTSLNAARQRALEKIVSNYVAGKNKLGINNASALLLNYKSMQVEAMVGSADFFNKATHGQVNAATAKRSPGSTLKPFVYALAIDEGIVHPMSLLKDSPRRFGGFTPENYDKQFLGPVSVKQALIQSRNVPAVNLQARLRKQSFYDFLKLAGVSALKAESHYGLALALGGGEVSMLELASMYAALANQGRLKTVQSVLPEQESGALDEGRQILSAEASFLTLDMLKDNPQPDALSMSSHGKKNQVAWKTGTSWAFRDAWAVGVSGDYVLVVWVGNFDGRGNEAFIGRSAAGPLMFSIFDAVNPQRDWQVADTTRMERLNLKQLDVCVKTGDLVQKHCPSIETSWFIPGVSPIKLSNIYRSIPVNIDDGLRACFHQPGMTELQVFEFWPSDFMHIFRQAGISLKTPPSYRDACKLASRGSRGQEPKITSPQVTIEYAIRVGRAKDRQIPLQAILDPDVLTVHWFVDDAYIGSAVSGQPVLWDSNPGEFSVRAVDDAGRSSVKKIVVRQL